MTSSGTSTPATVALNSMTDVRQSSNAENDHQTVPSVIEEAVSDIEHLPVQDDPRKWSPMRKNFVLGVIASGSMIAGFGANIQNPAIEDMERDLPATSGQISLSVSLFIALQGVTPLLWSSISEVKGRRFVYLISLLIFIVGSIIVATSKTIDLVIGMRCLQALGSSAVMTIGAASLADIFDPEERGRKMGIYYISPLLGPSLGPVFGGVLTTGFNWRAPFWFLAILAGTIFLCFLFFFKDTYRKERSYVYQNILKRHLKEQAQQMKKEEKLRAKEAETLEKPKDTAEDENIKTDADLEKQEPISEVGASTLETLPTIKLSLRDVNPVHPLWLVLRRRNNILMLLSSGILFSYCFIVVYTTSRTLGSAYGYDALTIGFILLSFGLGSMAGSILGGRFSDRELARLKRKNEGRSHPEMRLKSTIYSIWLFPMSVVGLAWVCQQHVHVAAICVMLFVSGFFAISAYASELAYIVDANVGRSSSAVSLNSSFRGMAAFIGTEIAVPVQDKLGDGWMYTIFAIILLLSGLLVLLVIKKGEEWRVQGEASEGDSKS
ncbi:MFS general substrate transporter [Guyanagaster necrorhizus]|uniref:MFS general substrate transporter n=1 Tax=Guyanagaster necrorhizus TaxID=856835 RepID=A0A9P8AQL0_9AGAR|nr:MFS general substrate transporter [Guyanagaster necrorhizus MCA 3950]KAG7444229.1 MFS general substrate transporter [Guyanagaster necrorhizus MCA 3950]